MPSSVVCEKWEKAEPKSLGVTFNNATEKKKKNNRNNQVSCASEMKKDVWEVLTPLGH